MRRKLIYTLASLAGVLVALILVSLMFLLTEAGSRWLIHHGLSRVSTRLKVDRIQGSVLTGLSLYGIEYLIDQQHTRIEHVELSWQPMALLDGRVHLKSLYMEGITYTAPVRQKTSVKEFMRTSPDISFPLAVVVEDAKLERLVFHRGNIKHTLDKVHLTGRLDRDGLRLKHFEAEGKDIRINLQGHAANLSQPYLLQANFSWSVLLSNSLTARGKCDLMGNFEHIKLSLKLKEPFLLETKGELELKPVLLESDDIGEQRKTSEPFTAEVAFNGGSVQYHPLNKPDLYRLNFQGDVSGQNLPPTQVKLSGLVNFMGFQVDKMEASTLDGILEIKGHFAWQSEQDWKLKVNAHHIDPGLFWTEWPGKLDFKAELQGGINPGTPTFLFNQITVAGRLMEQPFQVEGDMTIRGKELKLENLMIRLGQNRLRVNGTAASHLDLSFNFDMPSPAVLWPGFRGVFQGQGSLRGSRSNPAGTLALVGNNIGYGLYTVKNLNTRLTIDEDNTERSSGLIKLYELAVGNQVFDSLSLNWSGDFKKHKVRAEIVSTSAIAHVEFGGSSHKDTWKLAVDTISFDTKGYGSWHLLNPADLLVSHGEIKPFQPCWSQKNSKLCVQVYWNDESGWMLKGDTSAQPIRHMIDLLIELFKKENLGWGKGA